MRPSLDGTLTIEYKADTQYLAFPAQSATTGIIWQCVTIQECPLLADKTLRTLTMKMQNTYTIDHHDTGKGTITVPVDLKLLPAKHTLYPFTYKLT